MSSTTNTTKLRATIFPLRNISPTTHTYGFLSSIHPLDADGFAVPQNDLVLNVSKDKGYRYYSYIKDIEIIDILGLLKEQTAKLTSTLSMETTYFQVSKINLMSLDNVLLPSDFDGDNITEFNNVNVLSDINFQYQNIETADSEFIKYSGTLKDETRDAKIRVTFTNGANSHSYDVYFSTLIATTTVTYWVPDEPLYPGYYDTITIPNQKITHDDVGGAYAMLADDLNFLKTLENSLPSLLNMKTGATIYSEKNILKKQKVSFTFKTPLNDEAAGTSFSSLQQFMTRYGFERFGVAIHEDGVTPTRIMNTLTPYDTSTDAIGLDPDVVHTYGICNYLSHSLEENTVTWSGYYYRLPRSPELFNLVKFDSLATDPTCVLGAGFENFIENTALSTVTRDVTDLEDDVVFLANCVKDVDIISSIKGVIDSLPGATVLPSMNIKAYCEFDIRNLTATGTGTAQIKSFLRTFNDVTRDSDVILISNNGRYRITYDVSFITGFTIFSVLCFTPNVTVPVGATVTFSITNVFFGECV